MNKFRRFAFASFALATIAALVAAPAFAQVKAPVKPKQKVEVDSDRDSSSSEREASEAPTGEMKTVAVVAAAKYDKLISDINFLGSLTGKPQAGQMVEGMFAFFTQGKGAAVLDKAQPWGVIVRTDGSQFYPIGCLPVKKEQDLVDIAVNYGADVKDADGGSKELAMPNGKSVFLKHENGWAFVSLAAGSLERLPENPEAGLSKLVTEYDLAARISVKDIPEMYREFAIQAMQSGMQNGMQKKDNESDEQFELRQKFAEAQMKQMVQMINEVDSITFGWAVDSKEKRTYADFLYAFKPGSKLAKQMASYEKPQTNFAGFFQPDAAATLSFAAKADPKVIAEDIEQFEGMMQNMRMGFNNGVDESEAKDAELVKDVAGDFFDAVEATFKAGHFDGGAALHIGDGSMKFVAGAVVADTDKIESGLKKLDAAAKEDKEDAPEIKWNAAEHAGVKFHTISVPVPESEEEAREILGPTLDLAVGIGDKVVYVGGGDGCLEALNSAIDASAKEPNKSVPSVEFALSLAPILKFAAEKAPDDEKKQVIQDLADMLAKEGQGRDHVRITGKVAENGLRYRLEAEEGVMKAIGKGAAEAQRKAMKAQQAQQ